MTISPIIIKGKTTYVRTGNIKYPVHIRRKTKSRWHILEEQYTTLVDAVNAAKKYKRVVIASSDGTVYYARHKSGVIISLPI